jgi:hypothetical protein
METTYLQGQWEKAFLSLQIMVVIGMLLTMALQINSFGFSQLIICIYMQELLVVAFSSQMIPALIGRLPILVLPIETLQQLQLMEQIFMQVLRMAEYFFQTTTEPIGWRLIMGC